MKKKTPKIRVGTLNPTSREDYLAQAVKISKALASAFTFGFHTADDIAQECIVMAAEAYDSGDYDPGRPAGPFIRVHLTNRLRTRFRSEVWRSSAPCKECASGNPCGVDDLGIPKECETHLRWVSQNYKKGTLARAAFSIDQPVDREVPSGEGQVDFVDLIDSLPAHLRAAAKLLMNDDRANVDEDTRKELQEVLSKSYNIQT